MLRDGLLDEGVPRAVRAARLARVSIYDRVGGATVNDILYRRATVDAEELRAFIDARAYAPNS